MKKVKSNTGGNTLRKKMKQRSRKIKSKRLSNYVRKKILKAFPHLKQKDVMLPKTGPDFILSKNAKKLLLHQFELKNQEKMNTLYKWFSQASKNTRLDPVVVCKKNGSSPLAIIDLDHFIDLIK